VSCIEGMFAARGADNRRQTMRQSPCVLNVASQAPRDSGLYDSVGH
jgi:hypothetical protein